MIIKQPDHALGELLHLISEAAKHEHEAHEHNRTLFDKCMNVLGEQNFDNRSRYQRAITAAGARRYLP